MEIGADVGGTFTDLVWIDRQGETRVRKVPSSPPSYEVAIVSALRAVLAGERPDEVHRSRLVHGTTVATNAVLERKGAVTALLTTEGFRDVLELRRIRIPHMYDLLWQKPEPLVARDMRFEVPGRMSVDGEVLRDLDEAAVVAVCDALRARSVEAVAICLLHGYRFPEHERRCAEIVRRELPAARVWISSDVLRERGEYERSATTVVNAYVGPIMADYLQRLQDGLELLGVRTELEVMRSSGGLMSMGKAKETPVFALESGPAAGAVGAAALAAELGIANAIAFDMGGTTTKASVLDGGKLHRTREYEVGGAISTGIRLIRGTGELLRVPSISIAEIGAGGGSIVHRDLAGDLHVGPSSAGADPGPACYGIGGEEPTVTDANVVLGYIPTGRIADGSVAIDRDRAVGALRRLGASGIGLDGLALGIHEVANARMMRALRAVTSERGRDPEEFTMIAYGGSGPIHATGLADLLGIKKVVVPQFAGVFSARGLLCGRREYEAVRPVRMGQADVTPAQLRQGLEELQHQASGAALAEGADVQCTWSLDMRYRGQGYEIEVEISEADVSSDSLDQVIKLFKERHQSQYGVGGYASWPVEIRALRVMASVGRGSAATAPVGLAAPPGEGEAAGEAAAAGACAGAGAGEGAGESGGEAGGRRGSRRPARFSGGIRDVPVYGRQQIGEAELAGPALIDEYDTTVVVRPGWTVRKDPATGALVLSSVVSPADGGGT